jgi:hypothetical protein
MDGSALRRAIRSILICCSITTIIFLAGIVDLKSAEREPVFTVLNPEGIPVERQVSGLNPRLETLKGKKVNVINLHGANEKVMESIARDLKATVPECNVVYVRPEGGWGGGPLTQEDWKKMVDCDAAIVGHNF